MIQSDRMEAGGCCFKEDRQICICEVLGPTISTTQAVNKMRNKEERRAGKKEEEEDRKPPWMRKNLAILKRSKGVSL